MQIERHIKRHFKYKIEVEPEEYDYILYGLHDLVNYMPGPCDINEELVRKMEAQMEKARDEDMVKG